jgi:hypothetical protein
MKLLHNVNLTKEKISLMLECESGLYLSVVLRWERNEFHSYSPHPSLVSVSGHIQTHTQHAHTHAIQRWRIDTRDSSRMSRETCTIDENMLEQRSQSTSCILSLPSQSQSSPIVFVLICETQFSHSHTHTPIHIEEKWNVSLYFYQFSSSLLCSLIWNTRQTHTNWKSFETICAML